MASPYGVDTLTTISRQYVMPDFMDEVYKSSPLIRRLYKSNRVTLQGGSQIEQGLLVSRLASGGAYEGYDRLDIAPSDTIRSAAWDWRQYSKPVAVDGRTLIKVNSPDATADYIRTYFQQAQMDMQADLAFDLWNNVPGGGSAPSNPKGLDGIRGAIDDAAIVNVYGGIDRSVTANAFWKAKADHATTALTLANLNAFHSLCQRGAYGPSAVYSRRDMYNVYWKLIATSTPTYQLPIQSAIDDEVAVQAGFTNLYFNNMPWLVDDYVPDGADATHSSVFFIDEKMAKLVVNTGRNFEMGDFQKGIDQDAMVAQILFAGNFILRSCNTSGVMTALVG